MNFIYVGDPHIQPSNINDGNKIMELVLETAKEKDMQTVIIGGDLFHTHGIINLNVQKFWLDWTKTLSENFKEIHYLVGNHDQKGDRQSEKSMSALDSLNGRYSNVFIWNRPGIHGDFGFIPYISDNNEFIENATQLHKSGATWLFCHQTFAGSVYDNGFYAPNGIEIEKLPIFNQIVSGHIHKTQTVGLIFYPGTPKWDSLSDANEQKGIWVYDGQWNMIDMSSKIEPIRSITVTPESNLDDLVMGNRTVLELVGQSSWINKVSKTLKGKCRIVARPTDKLERQKNNNIPIHSIYDYLQEYAGISEKSKVKQYLNDLLG